MTVLLIVTFPALKHESLILCVSLSSILHPKCFHSTDFKFHLLFEGVHWKCLVFPCPYRIFLLTHSLTLFPEIIVGTTILKKKNKPKKNPKPKNKENFPILLISMEFPWCPFSVSVDLIFFAGVNSVRKKKTSLQDSQSLKIPLA